MQKNVSGQKIVLLALDTSANSPKTGDAANLTAYVSKDWGAVTVLTDTTATELDATNAPGLYSFDLTQAETNADELIFSGKSATANIKLVPRIIQTVPGSFSTLTIANNAVDSDLERIAGSVVSAASAQLGVNVVQLSGDATAADNAEAFFDGTGYAGTGNVIPTVTTVTNQLTAAQIATGIWQDSTAGDFTVASSIGKALYIANIAPGASGGHFIAGSNAGTTTVGAFTVTAALTAGTNAIPWNAAWDAEVQSEVDDALVVQRLDELLNADSDIDGAAPPTVGSVFHELLSKTSGSFTYDQTTDSLEAVRDRGDAAWITATGFSTHTAADVWSVATRVLTAGTNIQLPSNGLANVTSWTVAITGNITGNLSGSVGSLATQAKADVNAEVLDVIGTDTLIDGKTLSAAIQYVSAAVAGRVSGAGTGTEVFKGLDETTTRLTITVDSSGNRTDVTYG